MLNNSSIITVYHGSDQIIEKPLYEYGNYDCDYGAGFYLSEDIEKGRSWSVLFGGKEAINNQYELDLTNLNILNLDDYGPLAWVAEIIYNRDIYFEGLKDKKNDFIKKYKIDTNNADIIMGYRAGGNYMEVIKSFFNNQININEVIQLFKKEELGQQIYLKSKKAFQQIKFTDYENVQDIGYEKQAIYTRVEMSHFLYNRETQILEETYKPIGILLDEVLENKYDYDLNYDYLQKDMSWNEYEEYLNLLKEEQKLNSSYNTQNNQIGEYKYERDDYGTSL